MTEIGSSRFFMPLHLAVLQSVKIKEDIQQKYLNLKNIYVADKAWKQISPPASLIHSILPSGTCFIFCTKEYQELFSNWSISICNIKYLFPTVADCRGLSRENPVP